MIINTRRFGTLSIDDDKLIEFPFGIPGFPELKDWCVLHTEENRNVHWLQAIQDPDTALLIADPDILFPDYNAEVEERDLAPIGVKITAETDTAPPIVLHVVLSVDRAMGKVAANLRAPILINVETRQGIQIALKRGDYSVRQPLPKLKRPLNSPADDSPMERVSDAASS